MKFWPGVVPQWPSSRGLMWDGCKRLAQQRIVEQIDLADGQVVGGAPVGVDAGEEIRRGRHGMSFRSAAAANAIMRSSFAGTTPIHGMRNQCSRASISYGCQPRVRRCRP